jgi:hypothetical protein
MSAQVISIAEVSSQKRVALINRYAALNSELAKLKTEVEMAKVELIEILGEGSHETSRAKITINWTSRPVLDQGKAKSFLTAGQLAESIKTSSYFDVRCKFLGV